MTLFDDVKKQLAECVANNREDIVPEDGDTYFGLPKPYSVPTPGDCFHEMYYWDTYFTNVGFLAVGNIEQSKNNVENIMFLIERFGFMPNGSRKRYLYHSQPPFFAQMVKEVYEADGDKVFLKRAYKALKKEHVYWTENRTFSNGLAHYGFLATDPYLQETRKNAWNRRTGLTPDPDLQVNVGNFIGYCESGWDCTPRLESHSFLYSAVDLNALLWNMENCISEFAEILENGEAEEWKEIAEKRRQTMFSTLWNEERGCFSDWQNEKGFFSPIFSAAAFYPLYFGLATPEQAKKTVEKLDLLEHHYGLTACQEYDGPGRFQWGAPNLWPCIQWMVAGGLLRYGFRDDAMRIINKYVMLIEESQDKTGQLWEKYNADTGLVTVASEYKTPPMMGWTAGIYLKCKSVLEK